MPLFITLFWLERFWRDTTLPRTILALKDTSAHYTILLTITRKMNFSLHTKLICLKLCDWLFCSQVTRLIKLISINKRKMLCFHIIEGEWRGGWCPIREARAFFVHCRQYRKLELFSSSYFIFIQKKPASKTREKCGIKYHVCYRLFILTEEEPNLSVREWKRLREKREREIYLVSSAKILSF
jgi:hypothetical protein